jgi:hypothetical protein
MNIQRCPLGVLDDRNMHEYTADVLAKVTGHTAITVGPLSSSRDKSHAAGLVNIFAHFFKSCPRRDADTAAGPREVTGHVAIS